MERQKKINELRDKLTAIEKRTDAARTEEDAKLKEAQARLYSAKIALESAGDPEEYQQAKKAIESAENEIDFYTIQHEKRERVISESEYAEAACFLDDELERLISDTRKDLKAEYDALSKKLEKYNQAARNIIVTKSKLNKLAAKTYIPVGETYARMLIHRGEFSSYDPFSRFCDFYDKQGEAENSHNILFN